VDRRHSSTLPEEELVQARGLAFEAANALKKPMIVLDLETLFSTQEIDDMAHLIRDYGRDAVLEGLSEAISHQR
jgi:hypothetical protein